MMGVTDGKYEIHDVQLQQVEKLERKQSLSGSCKRTPPSLASSASWTRKLMRPALFNVDNLVYLILFSLLILWLSLPFWMWRKPDFTSEDEAANNMDAMERDMLEERLVKLEDIMSGLDMQVDKTVSEDFQEVEHEISGAVQELNAVSEARQEVDSAVSEAMHEVDNAVSEAMHEVDNAVSEAMHEIAATEIA